MGRHVMTDAGVCNTCHRPMRGQRVKAGDAPPGTTVRSGPGICVTCRAAPNRATRRQHQQDAAPDPNLVAWRICYEADRRHRGIPPEGIPDEDL